MNALHKQIEGKSAIIIDVYDVLLFQLYCNPSDLIRGLERSSSIVGFFESRMNADQSMVGNDEFDKDDANDLDVIYGRISQSYRHIKEKEIALKELTTKVNPEILSLFQKTVQKNIPVYLCGKFDVSTERIEKFLNQNGYNGYRRLYSLSSNNVLKDMYREIEQDTSAKPHEILHITSNSDNTEANKMGISVFVYESLFRKYGQNLNSSYFAVLNKYRNDDLAIPLLQSSISLYSASEKTADDWNIFGYKYIGILAYEYAKNIGNIVNSLDIKKVFFSSQNGYCLKAAFEILFPNIESEIITCSKRANVLSTIHTAHDIAPALLKQVTDETTFRSWIALLIPTKQGEIYQAYTDLFQEQDKIISSDGDFEQLRDFIAYNEQFILEEAAKEKEKQNQYLSSLGLFSASSAIVDISRDLNLLSGLASLCCSIPMENDLTAFFWDYSSNIRWRFSLLNQMKKSEFENKNSVTDNQYLDRILALALSDPNQDSASFENHTNTLSVVPFCGNNEKNLRISISRKILVGATACINDLYRIDSEFPLPQHQGAAMAVCEYLQKHIQQKDKSQLELVHFTSNPYDWDEARPIFSQGRPVIGIVNPWPEDVSAEAEVITRLKRTADENNIGCVLLDTFGHILNDNQKATKKFINEKDLSFIITTHYECAKVLNVFYYNPLWNPPEIPLNLSEYTPRVTNLFMSNDDYLIYDDGGMSNHLRSVLMNCPRTLEGASALTASFPVSAAMPPKLDKPIMFYCGMNWEIMFGTSGRHEGLFKLLDNTGKIKYYGPERVEAWGGLKPWDGYRCYLGMIPFDGFSIVEKINECGICLVLSSDTHRRAGAATNRLYEACAAGAVIISDDNEFVLEHFGDAALFIKFNKNDPLDTFNQIMEKYNWIVKHPDEALQLARRAQEIYLNEYSLDNQLKRIVQNHPARLKQLGQDLYAQCQNEKVLVTFVLDTQELKVAQKWLDIVINNVHGQIYSNLELAIAADATLSGEIKRYCYTRCASANVVSMDLFDKKGVRALTDGEAIRALQKQISHDYYINTTAEEAWFFDHLTSLVRAATENDCLGAYSGAAFEGSDGCRRVNFFDVLHAGYLYHMSVPRHPLAAGQFLFRADANTLLPDYLFGNLDGEEHIAYAGIVKYRHRAELAFTKRMSLCVAVEQGDERCKVLSKVMQHRFIQDLIRFYVPEQVEISQVKTSASALDVQKKDITDMFLYFPVKVYLRLRYYRFRMRGKNSDSKAYKKYAAKYDAYFEQYRQYWNV